MIAVELCLDLMHILKTSMSEIGVVLGFVVALGAQGMKWEGSWAKLLIGFARPTSD